MNRRDSGPGRGTQGRVADAVYPDGEGYPDEAYPDEAYLEAGTYPVDPGYRTYPNGRPRPADMPAGPPRIHPERGMPPRPGFPARPSRQGPRDQAVLNRPWPRPEDAMPGIGRPRSRPASGRPRPQGGNRTRPAGMEDVFGPSGGRVPPGRRPAPPRGPRPGGFYGPPPGRPNSAGQAPRQPDGRPGWQGAAYGPGGGHGPGAPGPGQPYGSGAPRPGSGREQYGPGQYGPGPGHYGPGGQPHPGADPYAPGGYPYRPEAAQYGPGEPHGPDPRGRGQPGPGYGQASPGPGPYGPGQYGAGQYGPGQWGPQPGQEATWAGPGQHRPWEQHRPGTGTGRPGYPPRGDARPGVRDTGGWGRAGGTVIRQRDSALPDPPPNAKAPIAAIENDNIAAFARDLRVLRSKVGLDYPDMAEKSHYTMRTLASAAGGLRLPTLPVLIAYVKACGGDATEWEERWGKLVKSGKKGHAALPAAGASTSGDEPGATANGLPGDGHGGPGRTGPGPVPPTAPPSGEVYVITSAKPRDDRW